jgi:ribosomal protein S18 acetylase RimI-like enzyme
MTAGITVRRAAAADAARLAELFSLYRAFYGQAPDVAAAARFLRARLDRGESIVFVAEADGGRAVGFVQVYPTFGSIELGRAWRLNDLYVHESARGSGVGESLMRAVTDAASADGVAWVDLETARDNAVAQRLYERAGYVRDDVYVHYVKDV